jgi:hypothetical protein
LLSVTLQGSIPNPMLIKLATKDFRATFNGEQREASGVERGGSDVWAVSGQSGGMTLESSIEWKAGKVEPLSISVAFALPEAINRFELDCGGLVLGTVTIEAEGATPAANAGPVSAPVQAAPAGPNATANAAPEPGREPSTQQSAPVAAPAPPTAPSQGTAPTQFVIPPGGGIRFDRTTQVQEAQPRQVNLSQTIAIPASGTKVSLKKVALTAGSYEGMRPFNAAAKPQNDGVLAVVGMVVAGKADGLSASEIWLTDDKGQRNAKADMVMMSKGKEFTLLFNVPLTAQKIVLHFGDAVAIDLAPFLQPAPAGSSLAQPVPNESPAAAAPAAAPQVAPPAATASPITSSYVMTYVQTDRKTRGGVPFNSISAAVLKQLEQLFRDQGLTRSDSLTGTCCKVEFELLEASHHTGEFTLSSMLTATLSVHDAGGRQVYAKGYETKGQTAMVEMGNETVRLGAQGLAEEIAKDVDLIKVLSGAGQPAAAPGVEVAEVNITSTPDGGEVQVNGAAYGNTPLALKLAPGEYRIVVTKQGYNTWERKLKIASAGKMRVQAVLTVQQANPQ